MVNIHAHTHQSDLENKNGRKSALFSFTLMAKKCKNVPGAELKAEKTQKPKIKVELNMLMAESDLRLTSRRFQLVISLYIFRLCGNSDSICVIKKKRRETTATTIVIQRERERVREKEHDSIKKDTVSLHPL